MSGRNDPNLCYEKPCQSRMPSHERQNDPKDANSEVRGRPVLYTGVVWIGMLRRFLIPRTCGSSLPPILQPPLPPPSAQDKPRAKKVSHITLDSNRSIPSSQLSKPTLLTTKSPNHDDDLEITGQHKNDSIAHSPLASLIAQIREASASATGHVQELSRDIRSLVQEGRTTTSETISILRSEEAVQYRWTMITLCGLVGYLAGLRRSSLTRIVYSTTGATAMATICYPYEARIYNSQGLMLLRQCVICGISLIKDGHERGPGVGKENSKASNAMDSPNNYTLNQNKYTKEQHIHQQTYNSQTNFNPAIENFRNVGIHNVQVNSKANYDNESCPEIAHQRDLQNCPSNLIQESSIMTRNSGKESLNLDTNNGKKLPFDSEKTSLPDNTVPYLSPPTNRNNQNNYSNVQTQRVVSQEKTSITDGKNIKLHTYISHNSSSTPDIHINVAHEELIKDDSERHSSNKDYQFISVPEPTLVIEEENISNTIPYEPEDSERIVHPLNKKLSRYYIKQPDESMANADKVYDDLYSKRNSN